MTRCLLSLRSISRTSARYCRCIVAMCSNVHDQAWVRTLATYMIRNMAWMPLRAKLRRRKSTTRYLQAPAWQSVEADDNVKTGTNARPHQLSSSPPLPPHQPLAHLLPCLASNASVKPPPPAALLPLFDDFDDFLALVLPPPLPPALPPVTPSKPPTTSSSLVLAFFTVAARPPSLADATGACCGFVLFTRRRA